MVDGSAPAPQGTKPPHKKGNDGGDGTRKRPHGSAELAKKKKKKDPLVVVLAKPKQKKHPLEKARDARARELYALDVGANPVSRLKDKKLKARLKQTEGKYQQAALEAARSEMLLPEEAGYLEPEGPLEQTWKLSQREVRCMGWIDGQLDGVSGLRCGRMDALSALVSIHPPTRPLPPSDRCGSTWTCRRPARCSRWSCRSWGPTRWTSRATGGTRCWAGRRATWR